MGSRMRINSFRCILLRPAVIILAWLLVSCTVQTEFINEPAVIVPVQLHVTPDPVELKVGEEVILEPQFFDSLGLRDTSVKYVWNSLDSSLFSVEESGKVRGKKNGMGLLAVEVRYTNSEVVIADTLSVFVSEQVVSISFSIVNPGESSTMMTVGNDLKLSAETDQIPDSLLSSLIWMSTDTLVIQVSSNGHVTAVGPGKASIFLSLDSLLSNPVQFTISSNIRSGFFIPRPGSSYNVEGETSIFFDDAGDLQVMFQESFKTSSGPGLGVYLSPTEQVSSSSLRLGALQAVEGSQTYAAPPGTGINDYDWIIIHCEPFDVSFGYAELE